MPYSDRYRSLFFRLFIVLVTMLLDPSTSRAAIPAAEGFGASTPGGSGKSVVTVTNLKDSGAGSLRDALSQGNRYVVFKVAGTINLSSVLDVLGSFVTVDGLSAPSPGITIRRAGLRLAGTAVHDVVISGVRIRKPGMYSAEGDGITIKDGVYNVVLDHISADSCSDGNIDITKSASDVTVQWSVLSNCAKNMLINYQARHVSIHHNIWVDSQWRNPNIQYDDAATTMAPDITADFRNNIVWNWGDQGGGTILQCGARANVINNFYHSGATTTSRKQNAIVNDGCPSGSAMPSFYASGNLSGDKLSFDINSLDNASSPYSSAAVTTQQVCSAAKSVLSGAGVRPLDSVDQLHVGKISLATCPAPAAPAPTLSLSASPTTVASGQPATLSWAATDATSCTASGGWSGSRTVSGSATANPTATTTYSLSCTGSGGTVSKSTSVTVAPPPTVSLSASPTSVVSGQSSSLSWSSSNTTSCSGSGAWSGSMTASGVKSVTPTTNSTYTVTCTGTGGSASKSASVSVNLPAPTVSLTASPTSVGAGQSSVLSWSSTNATSCSASGGWSGTMSLSGSASMAPGSTTMYTMTCTGSSGSATQSATVSVQAAASPNAGYGSSTPGGYGQPVYHVTNLNDSGAGSLRDAVSQGNRFIVFDVAGTIALQTLVPFQGSYLTVDGLSAPSPGITITQSGLRVAYTNGMTPHDIVIRGIRIRNPTLGFTGADTGAVEGDGMTIRDGVYNILIDHVSVSGCGDGNIDITKSAHDVTVQWSVLSNCQKNMLINYQAQHISLHHNAWVGSQWRNPNIQYTDGSSTVAPDITADFRNNLIWGWGDNGGGTILQCGGKANVVGNFYFSGATTASRQANAIVNDGCPNGYPGPSFFASGNFSADHLSLDINSLGNVGTAFAAAPVDTQDSCVAAHDVLSGAGVLPWDGVDQQYLGPISLPTCP